MPTILSSNPAAEANLSPCTGQSDRAPRIKLCVALISALLAAVGCSSTPASKSQASPTLETKTEPTPQKETSNWLKDEKANVMDNTKEISLATSATGDQGGTLLIRFKGKQLDAFVATKEIVDDERASVRIKFDEGEPMKQVWGRSTDYLAVFSPDPVGLIKRLESSKKFYIEYRPYQKVPQTIIFDVSGLEPLLPRRKWRNIRKNGKPAMLPMQRCARESCPTSIHARGRRSFRRRFHPEAGAGQTPMI